MNYKDTLNLPHTAFPMKANLAKREPEMLRHWQDIKLYEQLRSMSQSRKRFVLHDGPPYANSAIHLGTALNKILKDMIIKSKILGGEDAPYVPGWDCHGLPIELSVEKKVGKPGVKISDREFRQACRRYADEQVAIQKADFIRLGVFGDWQHPYLTMNYQYEANVVRGLAKVIQNGHLVRGQKPVHWCTACGSALAEAEVEYREKSSPAIDVAFYVSQPNQIASVFGITASLATVILPIWTTTPWTLPANQAVALNPTLEYVLVSVQREGKVVHLIVAEQLLTDVMHRYGYHQYQVCGMVRGAQLSSIALRHPFLPKEVITILGDHVTATAGTGAVHTAPAHGQDDYVMGQRYHLPLDNPVNAKSCFISSVPKVAGMHVFKANETLITALADSGHLLHAATITHSYPHCWRHKTPLIFRATSQWFISMDKNGLRQMALKAIPQIYWMPEWGQARLARMIETRPDWCISRQRTWGTPLCLLVHRETGDIHPNMAEIMEIAARHIQEAGVQAWYDMDIADLLPKSDINDYEKLQDTLDVWFDAGMSHACVLETRRELACPADLYLEGSDQHRGWFQSSLLTGLAIRGQAPFRAVLTHGFVVDSKGHKMSKSLGNVISPKDVIKQFGADVLRLWVGATDHTVEIGASSEIFKRVSDAYRRIRNTARFLLSNLDDFDPQRDVVEASALVELDAWIIHKTQTLQKQIIADYESYQFPAIYHVIHNFCTIELGGFYLDIIKDRQYTAKREGLPRRSAQTAMYYVCHALVRWLAPMISFTAEEIWQHMPGKPSQVSVFLTTWYTEFPVITLSTAAQAVWSAIVKIRAAVNKVLEAARAAGDIGSALDAAVVLYADDHWYEALQFFKNELRFVLITSDAVVHRAAERPEGAKATELEGLWVCVSVSTALKCVRCWQHRSSVSENKAYPELCDRCILNVTGTGEQRHYA